MRTNTGQILYIPKIGQRANLQHPLMKGCVAWWPLTDGAGGIAKDISTGANDIVFVTAGWSAESIGTCLDAVPTSTTASTTLNHPAADVSYSLWIKGDTRDLIGLINGRSTLGGLNGTRVDLSSRKLKMVVDSSAGFLNTATSTTDVTPFGGGGWFHAACTWDGVDVKIYVNGSLETTVAHGGTLSNLESYDVNTPTTGVLDIQNVRIYNRALSSSEVLELYTNPWSGLSMPSSTRYFYFPTTLPLSETIGTFKMRNLSFSPKSGGRTIIKRGP